ncbi:inositol monophosphatase family protein [Nocardia gipuzkoensis]
MLPFDGSTVLPIIMEVAQEVSWRRRRCGVTLVASTAEGPTTDADLYAQSRLASSLSQLTPGARIHAEEGHFRQPVNWASEQFVWIIDPIDGSSNYLADGDDWGVQVAAWTTTGLCGGWIICPDAGWALHAFDDSELVVEAPEPDQDIDATRIVVAQGDWDLEHMRALGRRQLGPTRGTLSCAIDYAEFVTRRVRALCYRRSYVWDHAPGIYLARRAGAVATRWDGQQYNPSVEGEGLRVTADVVDHQDVWDMLRPPARMSG